MHEAPTEISHIWAFLGRDADGVAVDYSWTMSTEEGTSSCRATYEPHSSDIQTHRSYKKPD